MYYWQTWYGGVLLQTKSKELGLTFLTCLFQTLSIMHFRNYWRYNYIATSVKRPPNKESNSIQRPLFKVPNIRSKGNSTSIKRPTSIQRPLFKVPNIRSKGNSTSIKWPTSYLFNSHCSKSQIYEVRVILPPLSGQPLFNSHFSKSQIYKVRIILPPLSDLPLFNGHFYESQGWPLNGGITVFILNIKDTWNKGAIQVRIIFRFSCVLFF